MTVLIIPGGSNESEEEEAQAKQAGGLYFGRDDPCENRQSKQYAGLPGGVGPGTDVPEPRRFREALAINSPT